MYYYIQNFVKFTKNKTSYLLPNNAIRLGSYEKIEITKPLINKAQQIT